MRRAATVERRGRSAWAILSVALGRGHFTDAVVATRSALRQGVHRVAMTAGAMRIISQQNVDFYTGVL